MNSPLTSRRGSLTLRVRAGTLARLCTAACRAYPAPLRGTLLGTGDLVDAFRTVGEDARSSGEPPLGTFETRVDTAAPAAGGCPSTGPHVILEVAGPQADDNGGAPVRVTVIQDPLPVRLVVLPDEASAVPHPQGAAP